MSRIVTRRLIARRSGRLKQFWLILRLTQAFLRPENGHFGCHPVLLAGFGENLLQAGMVPGRGGIAFAKDLLVASAQAGEPLIQFIVKIGPLTVAQGYAERGEDVGGSVLVGQRDDAGDVLFIVLDEWENGIMSGRSGYRFQTAFAWRPAAVKRPARRVPVFC